MATLTIPNSFVNGTAAIASEVNANFSAIKTFAEQLALLAQTLTLGLLTRLQCLLQV